MLARRLARHATRYALSPTEVDQLEALWEPRASEATAGEEGGAGESAVILSRERFRPSEGVPLDDSDR